MIPDFLKNKLCESYGKEYLALIEKGYEYDRPLTLRINNLKIDIEWVLKYLDENNVKYERVFWYSNALIIKNKTEEDIRRLDIYEKGYVYFQSLSSMLPPLFMNLKPNEQILDMAAAPGGKTAEMAALSDNRVMITAVEKNKIRADRLRFNIEKQGVKRVSIIEKDARYLDEFFIFDKILLDAPCSGSGTLNIKQDLNTIFSEALVERSVKVQEELLNKAIKHLKPSGELIYSTCSILKEENEEILNKVLKTNKDVEIIPLDISEFDLPLLPVLIPGTVCVMPNELYEGFFVAKLLKK